jgi:RNA recognition motif-containing protein
MNIYVGNLAHDVNDQDLRAAFEEFGQVSSAKVIMDRETRESRGFGFVEMPSDDDAQKAINGLNGQQLKGRTLRVNVGRPREDRPQGGGDRRGPRRF